MYINFFENKKYLTNKDYYEKKTTTQFKLKLKISRRKIFKFFSWLFKHSTLKKMKKINKQ